MRSSRVKCFLVLAWFSVCVCGGEWGGGRGLERQTSVGSCPKPTARPWTAGPCKGRGCTLPWKFSFRIIHCEPMLTSDWNLHFAFLRTHVSKPDF